MSVRTLPPYLMLNGPEAEGTSTPPADPAPATPAGPPADPATPQDPAAPGGEPTPEPAEPEDGPSTDGLPEWARKSLSKANQEAAAARVAAKKAKEDAEAAQKQLVQSIGKALGLVKDDEPPTVDGLQQALQEKDSTLTAAQAEAQALRIENAILRYADKHGGDADALTDSESFKAKLKDLDASADDYTSRVEELVKSTVESNARFRKVQVATSNSNGQNTPTGNPSPSDDDTSLEALKRRREERRKNRRI